MIKYYLLFISFIVFSCYNLVSAQEFEHVDVGAFVNHTSILTPAYSDVWSLTPSYGLEIRLPYYVGEIGLSFHQSNYTPKNINSDKFSAFTYQSVFGIHVVQSNRFTLNYLIGVGIQKTKWLTEDVTNSDEREMLLLKNLELGLNLGNIIIVGKIGLNRLFYYNRQDNFVVGMSARYRIRLNNRLQEIIH